MDVSDLFVFFFNNCQEVNVFVQLGEIQLSQDFFIYLVGGYYVFVFGVLVYGEVEDVICVFQVEVLVFQERDM